MGWRDQVKEDIWKGIGKGLIRIQKGMWETRNVSWWLWLLLYIICGAVDKPNMSGVGSTQALYDCLPLNIYVFNQLSLLWHQQGTDIGPCKF